jgi:hypothetical protein
MTLKYQQPRNIKQVFTTLFNKIFSLNSSWLNHEVEVITLSEDNSPQAFEQYPWNNEKYPLIVLFSEGVTDDHWAIDSRVGYFMDTLCIGKVPRNYLTLSSTPVAFGVRSNDIDLTFRQVEIAAQNIGPYEEDIVVKIWNSVSGSSGYTPNTVISSGSISGNADRNMNWLSTGVKPAIILSANTNYFISVQAGGSYYLMLDTLPTLADTSFISYTTSGSIGWSIPDTTKTVLARVNGPVYHRMGGGLKSRLRVFVESKDLPTTQKITDLLFVYLHLLKHSDPTKKIKMPITNETAMSFDFASDLTDEGIYILDVNKGSETVRNRGNDRLFSIDLTINCYSSWSEDFGLPTLEDIGLDISDF